MIADPVILDAIEGQHNAKANTTHAYRQHFGVMEANIPAIPPLPPLPPLPLSPLAPVLTPTPARPSLYTPVLPLLLPPLALPPLALLVVPGGGLGGPSGFLVSKWRPAQPRNEPQVQATETHSAHGSHKPKLQKSYINNLHPWGNSSNA